MDKPFYSLLTNSYLNGMALLCPTIREATKVNFENDHNYTLNSLIEELTLVERHIRDGSWLRCNCNPEKHLPLIAGLASEGYGFTKNKAEKEFMRCLRDSARITREKMEKGLFRDKDAEKLRAWAREMRHRIEYEVWQGKLTEAPELEEQDNELFNMVESLNALKLSTLPEMEDQNTGQMVALLCKKYQVPMPTKISFTKECDPLHPNAAHIQRDERTEDGLKPRPEMDELVFCRGGVNAYTVAHEFQHYMKHFNGDTHADEYEANEFALKEAVNGLYTEETRLRESRNNLYTAQDSRKEYIHTTLNHTLDKDMAIDKKKGTTIVVGLAVAKLTDKYVSPALDTPLGAYASVGKIALGAGALYYGLKAGSQSMVKDLIAFVGAELVLTELFKYLPGGTVITRAPVSAVNSPIAIPMAPGGAVITAASQYSRMYQTPTRLTAGYPGVAQVDGKWIDQRV